MRTEQTIWVVDDDKSIRWVLEKALARQQLASRCFANASSLLTRLKAERPAAIISDIRMPGMDGLGLLRQIKTDYPNIPVIIMTAYADLERAVSAFQGGAYEYVPKPFDVDELMALVAKTLQQRLPKDKAATAREDRAADIIGSAPSMQQVFRAIARLSSSNLTVLITGESGTGKELVAAALHKHSARRPAPFIALNTAAIPRDLLESELFGHEKGAFTSADSQRPGRFEQADGGTLFLDEIGDMPADLQTRFLRVLADGEFYRIGGRTPIKANVRVVAATHQNLEQRVKDGLFREDLFHRLNVIRVHLPALRERREDIPALVTHFLQRAVEELGGEAKIMLKPTMAHLMTLGWPGNVRQLENFCRWVTVMAPGNEIHLGDLPPELEKPAAADRESPLPEGADWESPLRRYVSTSLINGEQAILRDVIPRVEQIMIEQAMQQSGGHKQEAAKLLGWGRNTLARKLRMLGTKR